MKILQTVTFIFLLTIGFQTPALNLVEMNQPVKESLYDGRSCNDLYMQASILEKESFGYSRSNSNNTQVASIVSVVFTPAIYYLGYSAFENFKVQKQSEAAFIKIEEIRVRMAEKRCFTK